ncbi:spore germination protein [Paenibacillus doosanensis]|uniref:Spore germination protein n=1 Tax=Paenibacillus konkukensis TaxID=2020716 RepID=A0ABY4RHV5_9BACL|nr:MULTISPECIES: GerAB/ArcD/ProY family transporter [Paenibacillus]MCS7460585.1 spore germination protein [Paenibacillus doosanensis]UQZ81194.1 Spore germination protein [Paenibacillus konkukensis]
MKSSSAVTSYEMLAIQMLYSGAAAGFIYPSFLIRSTAGAYWIPLAVWMTGAMLSSWLYSKMLARLEGNKLLAEIKASIGRIGATILCLPVMLFLVGVLVITLRAYSEIVTMTMLPTTPISFLNGMLIAPAALALAGMAPIIRAARVFFLLAHLLTVTLMVIGLSDVNWTLGSPWLKSDGDFFLDKQFYAGSFMWMGFAITSFIGPYTRESARRAWRSYTLALLCAIPLIASYIYLPVMTFGRDLSRNLTLPFVSKMDSIYHYWILFENLTAIFVSATMFYALFIMALKMHALGETFQLLFPRANARWIYAFIFIIVYAAATVLSSWRQLEHLIFVTVGLRFYVMFAFPLLALGIFFLARRRNAKGSAA